MCSFPLSERRVAARPCLAAVLTACLGASLAAADIMINGPVNHVPNVAVTGCPPGCTARVDLVPDPVAHLGVPGAGSGLDMTFTADQGQYPGWTLGFGAALNGTLNVTDYLAVDYGNCVGGARMDAAYTPGPGDPGTLTFLQMFTDDVGGVRMHIDPFPNDDTEPFYYTEDERTMFGLRFVDNPSDPCPGWPGSRTVRFETYLCSFDAAAMSVTVHDGWSWGYDLTCVPAPAALLVVAAGLLAGARRRRGPMAA